MNIQAIWRLLKEAWDYAETMLYNAQYIERELPNVTLPDDLHAQITGLCSSLIGTNFDIYTERTELSDILSSSQPDSAVVAAYVERIVKWLGEDIPKLTEIATALGDASRHNPNYMLASILIMESANNILTSFDRVLDAAKTVQGDSHATLPKPARRFAPLEHEAQTSPTPRIERIETGTLKLGPVCHETLTPQQIERLHKVQAALSEVDDSPLEKWIDDFRRDADPDREIAVFEAVAQAYQAFCSTRPRTLPQKHDVFGLLLERSGTTEEDILTHRKLEVLTPEEAREALSYYKKAATAIEVIQR
jgi:hypothetical protein